MTENKSEICAKLGELLKLTRAGEHIKSIEYIAEQDSVKVVYSFEGEPLKERSINTACDSGAQLIADVVAHIL